MGLALAFSFLLFSCLHGVSSGSHYFTSLFTFGDSYIDAGNFVIMATPTLPMWHDKPPYGMTFFGRPTGRLSDGRITINFIAEHLGLPLLQAPLLNSSDISKGVNFAVGGVTTIDVDFYERNKLVQFKLLNNSMNLQLGWFEELNPTICKKTVECFNKAIFFLGEFGVNDYNFLWNTGKAEDEVRSFVPKVVKNIAVAVERLIKGGAASVVVSGNPPNWCSPAMLTTRWSLNKTMMYDHIGCLDDINSVARYHNSMIRAAVVPLRAKYSHAKIIFADFYDPIITILENPCRFGVAGADALRACCGGGGEYNWNASAVCGMPGVTTCEDPSAFINWGGIHYTEATYRYITEGWLHGPFADPPILIVFRY